MGSEGLSDKSSETEAEGRKSGHVRLDTRIFPNKAQDS